MPTENIESYCFDIERSVNAAYERSREDYIKAYNAAIEELYNKRKLYCEKLVKGTEKQADSIIDQLSKTINDLKLHHKERLGKKYIDHQFLHELYYDALLTLSNKLHSNFRKLTEEELNTATLYISKLQESITVKIEGDDNYVRCEPSDLTMFLGDINQQLNKLWVEITRVKPVDHL
jgi:chlorite dismutase